MQHRLGSFHSSDGPSLREGVLFSWLTDLLDKLKELLSAPAQPVLVPVPVRTRPRRARR
ncbi:MAG: hypothetical protein ACKO6N_07920 [Myxococcota bacterium]